MSKTAIFSVIITLALITISSARSELMSPTGDERSCPNCAGTPGSVSDTANKTAEDIQAIAHRINEPGDKALQASVVFVGGVFAVAAASASRDLCNVQLQNALKKLSVDGFIADAKKAGKTIDTDFIQKGIDEKKIGEVEGYLAIARMENPDIAKKLDELDYNAWTPEQAKKLVDDLRQCTVA